MTITPTRWDAWQTCPTCHQVTGLACLTVTAPVGRPCKTPHRARVVRLCRVSGCGYAGSRAGLCGTHDNARARAEAEAAAAVAREQYRQECYARASILSRALWAVGVECTPRLSGVHLTMEAAERLASRLTGLPAGVFTSTTLEGATS